MLRWNLAGLALLTGVTLARADDVIRLGGSFSADDDTHLVARPYHGGHYHGGYRGHYHGGHYGGYRHYGHGGHYGGYRHYGNGGYYGGYRGFHGGYHYARHGYWGGYRPYYSSYYYRPYYSYYARPFYYSSYWPLAYPAYYYASPAYYFIDPCADELPAMPEATNLGSGQFAPPPPSAAPRQDRGPEPMPPVDRGNGGTYRYDGGPRQTVPMPGAGPASKPAAPPLPRDFKFVTQPPNPQPANPTYTYAAYGETTPRTATPAATRLVSSEAPLPPPRLAYAAFGTR